MTEEDRQEWMACVTASAKTVQMLMDITSGPRQGLVAAGMAVITVAHAYEVDKQELLTMLAQLWNMFELESERSVQ